MSGLAAMMSSMEMLRRISPLAADTCTMLVLPLKLHSVCPSSASETAWWNEPKRPAAVHW